MKGSKFKGLTHYWMNYFAPHHLPLSHPFCWSRTYLQKVIAGSDVKDESVMPDISGKGLT